MKENEKKQTLDKIGRLCREWRIVNGYTLTEIAKRMDVSKALLSQYETGKRHSEYVLMKYVEMGFRI